MVDYLASRSLARDVAVSDYQKSELWQQTLAVRTNDHYAAQRGRLRVVYEGFWRRGVTLAKRISSDLPGLTLHDEAHLAALWGRASQLTGPNYEINPLEAFILGGAILLHDAGHALAAYEGGSAQLLQTNEYKDALVTLLSRAKREPPSESEIQDPPDETAKLALFGALRRLHANQAEVLGNLSFDGVFLINDDERRDSLGELIGQVAAGHYWPRALLEDRFQEVRGTPDGMPQEWHVQPIKLACILRCADAIQIDQRRADLFSMALHQPRGLSRLHWIAQHHLMQPVVRSESPGPGALIFTSQNDFKEDVADAWWIAHDLIQVANEELQKCYELMKTQKLSVFTVNRVVGAENLQQLSRYIRTVGWKPVSAEVRVTDVQQIVRLFGGQAIYGHDLAVLLRELIQNGADAIRARRTRNTDPFYQGKIRVSLANAEEDDFWTLAVDDDGTGMSENVLTGPLLEFGKSFWLSEEAHVEFPGLVSTNIHQTGRFGIGFFSTLMLADRISVTSKRFDASEGPHSLLFREGLRLRPILSKAPHASLGQFSTRVELRVSAEKVQQLLAMRRNPFDESTSVTLAELVAHLCPCLDCDVYVQEAGDLPVLAHKSRWYEQDPLEWLREITMAGKQADHNIDRYLSEAAPLLRVLKTDDGRPCGRAAIGFGLVPSGVASVGGLVSGAHSRQLGTLSQAYVGAMPFEPDGPRRSSGSLLGRDIRIEAWASEQAQLLSDLGKNGAVRYIASTNVAAFGGDATPIAMIRINRELSDLHKVYLILENARTIYVPIGVRGRQSRWMIGSVSHEIGPGTISGLQDTELDFVELTLESWGLSRQERHTYLEISNEQDSLGRSFISILSRYTQSKGRDLLVEFAGDVLFARYKGEPSPRENLFKGTELRQSAVMLKLSS